MSEISIIIPCYQAEKYLDAAIESVLTQSFKDWRIIAVNDASTDETLEILQRWQKRLGEEHLVIVPHEVNRGLGAARNSGLKAAESQWIAFLDADDYWAPDHLEVALKAQKETVSCMLVFTETRSFWELEDESRYEKNLENPGRFPNDLKKEIFVRSFTVPSAALFPRSAWEKAGPFHTDRRIQGTEDHHFWISCINQGLGVKFIAGGACYYRRHAENMTGSQTANSGKYRRLLSRWRLMRYRTIPFSLRFLCLLAAVKGWIWAVIFGVKDGFWQTEFHSAILVKKPNP